MSRLKNIASKKWVSQLVWSAAIVAISCVLFFAVQRKKNANVETVNVVIQDLKGKKNLINEKKILQKFSNYLGYDLELAEIKDLDLRKLESLLIDDDRISAAEVFVDSKDRLNIYVAQKEPIIRIISANKSTFYLDRFGNKIPVIKGSAVRVPIATGKIEEYDRALVDGSKKSNLFEVLQIAKYINDDDFLSALIEQIDVDPNGELTMVPKIGRQKLDFGQAEELEDRFENLKIFYRKGMPKLGWRKHKRLKLNYKDMIVGEIR